MAQLSVSSFIARFKDIINNESNENELFQDYTGGDDDKLYITNDNDNNYLANITLKNIDKLNLFNYENFSSDSDSDTDVDNVDNVDNTNTNNTTDVDNVDNVDNVDINENNYVSYLFSKDENDIIEEVNVEKPFVNMYDLFSGGVVNDINDDIDTNDVNANTNENSESYKLNLDEYRKIMYDGGDIIDDEKIIFTKNYDDGFFDN